MYGGAPLIIQHPIMTAPPPLIIHDPNMAELGFKFGPEQGVFDKPLMPVPQLAARKGLAARPKQTQKKGWFAKILGMCISDDTIIIPRAKKKGPAQLYNPGPYSSPFGGIYLDRGLDPFQHPHQQQKPLEPKEPRKLTKQELSTILPPVHRDPIPANPGDEYDPPEPEKPRFPYTGTLDLPNHTQHSFAEEDRLSRSGFILRAPNFLTAPPAATAPGPFQHGHHPGLPLGLPTTPTQASSPPPMMMSASPPPPVSSPMYSPSPVPGSGGLWGPSSPADHSGDWDPYNIPISEETEPISDIFVHRPSSHSPGPADVVYHTPHMHHPEYNRYEGGGSPMFTNHSSLPYEYEPMDPYDMPPPLVHDMIPPPPPAPGLRMFF